MDGKKACCYKGPVEEKGLCFVKRIISLLLVFVVAFSVFGQSVSAAEPNKEEDSLVSDYEMIISEMNGMQNGDIKMVGDWKIICKDNPVFSLQSVYSDSRTASRTFTISRLGNPKNTFKITQTVSFVINDITQTVTITSYSSYATVYMKDYTVRKKYNDTIANGSAGLCGTARSVFDVNSSMDGTCIIVCTANVYMVGHVDFRFEAL